MNGKQHVAIGVTASVGATILTSVSAGNGMNPVTLGLVAVGGALGSYMPDIDSKRSKASQLFNKVLLGAIAGYGVVNVLADLFGINFLKDLMVSSTGNLTSNLWLMIFIALTIAGKLSPHRGFTHKWFGTAMFCIVAYLTFNVQFATGFVIGYLLHIAADRTTPDGKNLKFFEFRLPCQNSKGKFSPVF